MNLGTSDDKPTAWLEVADGFVIQVFCRNHSFDHLTDTRRIESLESEGWEHLLSNTQIIAKWHLFFQGFLLFLQGDPVIVLHGDHNRVNSLRNHSSILLLIMYRHLKYKNRIRSIDPQSKTGRIF